MVVRERGQMLDKKGYVRMPPTSWRMGKKHMTKKKLELVDLVPVRNKRDWIVYYGVRQGVRVSKYAKL